MSSTESLVQHKYKKTSDLYHDSVRLDHEYDRVVARLEHRADESRMIRDLGPLAQRLGLIVVGLASGGAIARRGQLVGPVVGSGSVCCVVGSIGTRGDLQVDGEHDGQIRVHVLEGRDEALAADVREE